MVRNKARSFVLGFVTNLVILGKLAIFFVISLFSYLIPKDDKKILFFSNPDYSDNPRYIYNKMIDLGLDSYYKLVWVFSSEKIPKKFLRKTNYVYKYSLRFWCEALTSKYLVWSHGTPAWKNKRQFLVFTDHGLPFKSAGHAVENATLSYKLSCLIRRLKVDLVLATSDFHKLILFGEYRVPLSKILVSGSPRLEVDVTSKQRRKLFDALGIPEGYSKYILYVPTFRDWSETDYSLDVLSSKKFYVFLKENNYLLVYKPHIHIERSLSFRKLYRKLSENKKRRTNILVISNSDLTEKDIYLYQILPFFDLILTDYSSIFYDACFFNKPVVFFMPDKDIYSRRRGFIFTPELWLPGPIVSEIDRLIDALRTLMNKEIDEYSHRRDLIKELFYKTGCELSPSEVVISKIFNRGVGND